MQHCDHFEALQVLPEVDFDGTLIWSVICSIIHLKCHLEAGLKHVQLSLAAEGEGPLVAKDGSGCYNLLGLGLGDPSRSAILPA